MLSSIFIALASAVDDTLITSVTVFVCLLVNSITEEVSNIAG